MDDNTRTIIAIFLVVVCVAIFLGTYILNKRTPKPEGCEDMSGECEGCQITSCSNYKAKNEKKEG